MAEKNKVKALIFDFDLTLVDSKGVAQQSREILFKEHNVDFSQFPESELWGSTFKANSQRAKQFSNTKLEAEEIEEILIRNCIKYYKDVKINAQDELIRWQESGINLCIVSGNTKEILEDVISNKHNCKIHFSAVYETNSGHSKAQRIIQCLNELGIDKHEAIYIGDHRNDVLAAKEAGIASCAVTTGFETKDDFLPYKPDIIIDKLEELKNYI